MMVSTILSLGKNTLGPMVLHTTRNEVVCDLLSVIMLRTDTVIYIYIYIIGQLSVALLS